MKGLEWFNWNEWIGMSEWVNESFNQLNNQSMSTNFQTANKHTKSKHKAEQLLTFEINDA